MNDFEGSFSNFPRQIYSRRLKRSLARDAQRAVAILNFGESQTVLTTEVGFSQPLARNCDISGNPGELSYCRRIDEADHPFSQMTTGSPDVGPAVCDGKWWGFLARFETGVEDLLMIRPQHTADRSTTTGVLSALWPVLREDCIADLQRPKPDMCENALLWMIADRIDVAIFIMNSSGQMLRVNAAASQLLAQEMVLKRTAHGIRCVESGQTREFHAALTRCAATDPSGDDVVVFVKSNSGQKIPLTLTRYWHKGRATELISVMIPSPPNSHRIEMLARAGGLTPAEARIASLLQLGMSNRDAANISGLKEQSVSTYAKRALSKLNVTSRAEMAQMLTWQAAGGHM